MDNGNLTQQPDISVEIGNLEKLLEKITVYAKDKNLDEFALPKYIDSIWNQYTKYFVESVIPKRYPSKKDSKPLSVENYLKNIQGDYFDQRYNTTCDNVIRAIHLSFANIPTRTRIIDLVKKNTDLVKIIPKDKEFRNNLFLCALAIFNDMLRVYLSMHSLDMAKVFLPPISSSMFAEQKHLEEPIISIENLAKLSQQITSYREKEAERKKKENAKKRENKNKKKNKDDNRSVTTFLGSELGDKVYELPENLPINSNASGILVYNDTDNPLDSLTANDIKKIFSDPNRNEANNFISIDGKKIPLSKFTEYELGSFILESSNDKVLPNFDKKTNNKVGDLDFTAAKNVAKKQASNDDFIIYKGKKQPRSSFTEQQLSEIKNQEMDYAIKESKDAYDKEEHKKYQEAKNSKIQPKKESTGNIEESEFSFINRRGSVVNERTKSVGIGSVSKLKGLNKPNTNFYEIRTGAGKNVERSFVATDEDGNVIAKAEARHPDIKKVTKSLSQSARNSTKSLGKFDLNTGSIIPFIKKEETTEGDFSAKLTHKMNSTKAKHI